MNTYLISYDLIKPVQNYEKVISHIKSSYAMWAKPQKSVWLIKTTLPLQAVRDNVRNNMDSNDNALVLDITGDNWATYNISSEVTQWMQNNV